MILAKNNIIIKIKDSDEYTILNPVSGSFDIMGPGEHHLFSRLQNGETVDQEFSDYLLERGYAYQNLEDEKTAIEKTYIEFKKEIADTQVQLMLIPTYGCNLACAYCYQHGVPAENQIIKKEMVDAFFDYARAHFSAQAKKPFITLFGGEPLINSPAQRTIIDYIVDKCVQEGYELAAVTNGYDFVDYVDVLKKAKIKEIQFTLDGSRDVHDKRRGTANNKGTFDKIIAGIDAAIKNKFPVNLRTVVDLENLEDLVNLAQYLDAKGWLDLPPELFKTQIGRNYELFDCYAKPQHLMTQAGLWAEYSAMSKRFPVLLKFHRPDFYGVRYIVDTGEMYIPSFDTCPAAKTEWVFDLNGEIYGCTASCGRKEYLLGTYFPEVKRNEEAINSWKTRDVKSIEKCRDCKYDVICGGGCGVVAANKNCGNALSPDCRPIQELLQIGINHYAEDIRQMTEQADVMNDRFAVESEISCNCENSAGSTPKPEGCLICGHELLYSTDPYKDTCEICGAEFETYVTCSNGHYICDACHGADILTATQRFLDNSTQADPLELAKMVFELPGLNMHGPEYHSIVPAILVTAYQNTKGKRDSSKIAEAIKRGRDIKGGSCGIYGSCGAAIGAGIAVSVIEKVTPMSKTKRGSAAAATGNAMQAISKYGGPRCCKREAVTTMETYIKYSGYFDDLIPSKYVCKQYQQNKDCIGKQCPYYPSVKIKLKGRKK